jgi:hypothetical protein
METHLHKQRTSKKTVLWINDTEQQFRIEGGNAEVIIDVEAFLTVAYLGMNTSITNISYVLRNNY